MKNLMICILLLAGMAADAQKNLPAVYLPVNLTVHFLSPEPIQYVDISSKHIAGDLPLKNVLRIRNRDSVAVDEDAVVTIAGEKFIAQYHVIRGGANVPTEIEINPLDTKPLDIADIGLSASQLKTLALNIASQKPLKTMEHVSAFGLKGRLNHIYTFGDYIFLDIGYENRTNLKFDIEGLRFKIDDKKVTKASNVQSVELKPEFVLFNTTSVKKHYRNIFVLRKMTFPGNKVLHIELSEKQISGRVIQLTISYGDVLAADQFAMTR